MAKKSLKQKIDRFLEKNPNAHSLLMGDDMDEIYNIGGTFNIIKYAFFFGYMQGCKGIARQNMGKYEKAIVTEQQKSINFISHIDEFWTLNQIYRLLVNITKGTKYEVFAEEKSDVKA